MTSKHILKNAWENRLFRLEANKGCSDVTNERLAVILQQLALEDEVVPLELRRILQAYDQGIEYVYNTYGTMPGQLYLDNDPEGGRLSLYWDKENTVYLFDNFIRILASNSILSDSILFKADWRYGEGHSFSVFDTTVLSGVEEAYHAHQHTMKAEIWFQPRPPRPARNATEEEWARYYCDDPIESDATHALLKAAQDMSLGRYGPTRFSPFKNVVEIRAMLD